MGKKMLGTSIAALLMGGLFSPGIAFAHHLGDPDLTIRRPVSAEVYDCTKSGMPFAVLGLSYDDGRTVSFHLRGIPHATPYHPQPFGLYDRAADRYYWTTTNTDHMDQHGAFVTFCAFFRAYKGEDYFRRYFSPPIE